MTSRIYKILFFLLPWIAGRAQSQDSLQGFDLSAARQEARSRGFYGEEEKFFITTLQQAFIQRKYKLHAPVIAPATVSKYNPSQVQSAACTDEDFESLPLGPIQQAVSGWVASEALNLVNNTILCGASPISFTPLPLNNMNALVAATPIMDANVGTIGPSPFGGNNVLVLNRNNGNTIKITRIRKTFTITTSNWFFKYAYRCVVQGAHACCDDANVIFRFYDCNNNPITAVSRTIVPVISCLVNPTVNCGVGTAPSMSLTASKVCYDADWVTIGVDLSPYVGTCVSAEVVAAQCTGNLHFGYVYYDAQCSGGGILVNNKVPPANGSYTACTPPATLSAPPCSDFSLWYGPPGSQISGVPGNSIVATVSGGYTLSSGIGTNTFVQTINLTIGPGPGATILSPNFSICEGDSIQLSLQGSGWTSIQWSTGHTVPAFTYKPSATVLISVTATNSLGCSSIDLKNIYLMTYPTIFVNSGTICEGNTFTINPSGALSYTIQGGSTVVSPSVTTTYSVIGSAASGCPSKPVISKVTVHPMPIVSVQGGTVCAGNSFPLLPTGAASYIFSSGTALVTPMITSSYTVTGTSTAGCTSPPAVVTLTVLDMPLPDIIVSGIPKVICPAQQVTLSASGASSYTWNNGATAPFLVVNPSTTSTYSVSGTNEKGCRSAPGAVATVSVSNYLKASYLPQPPQCLSRNVFNFLVNGEYPEGTSYTWDFTSSASPSQSGGANPSHIVFKETGVFLVKLTAQYTSCRDTFIDTVRVIDPPPAPSVNWDTLVVIGQAVPLNAYAGRGYTYTWTPVTEYLECSNCTMPRPISKPPSSLTYTVHIEDSLRCTFSQSTYRIRVEHKSSLDLPGAFTPNGDGINDVIRPDGWGLKKLLYFRVFNRWGQLVFETNNLLEAWDGTCKGVPQNMETYVYQVAAETYLDEPPLTKTGTFKLIR